MSDAESSSNNADQVDSLPTAPKRRRIDSRNPRPQSSKDCQLGSIEWSEEEKMQLAIALQQYGHKDVENLHKSVPTKTREQIKTYTYWVIKKARLWYCNDVDPGEKVPKKSLKGSTYTKAPLDQWLSAFEQAQEAKTDEFRDCLAKTFLYISRYEPHADPKDCDGVDYAAMYEFLYLALSGYPVKAVSPETASALLASLDELSEKIKQYDTREDLEFLAKVKRIAYVENATKRHYGRKKDSQDAGPMKSLLDVKGFNPLNIPYELLRKRPSK